MSHLYNDDQQLFWHLNLFLPKYFHLFVLFCGFFCFISSPAFPCLWVKICGRIENAEGTPVPILVLKHNQLWPLSQPPSTCVFSANCQYQQPPPLRVVVRIHSDSFEWAQSVQNHHSGISGCPLCSPASHIAMPQPLLYQQAASDHSGRNAGSPEQVP